MAEKAEKEVKFFENGAEVFKTWWRKHFVYIDGHVFGTPKSFSKGISFTVKASNGKDKDGNWRDSTFYNLTAFGELANQIQERYEDKDEFECIARFSQYKGRDGKRHESFTVVDVPRMKPENATENPYPSGEKAAPETKTDKNGDFEEAPSDDLPF